MTKRGYKKRPMCPGGCGMRRVMYRDSGVCRQCYRDADGNPLISAKTDPAAYHKQWREARGHHWRFARHIQATYGISYDRYLVLLERQGGKCAVCRTENPGPKRNYFCVDHCHTTGVVRGLLCDNCNLGIGKLRDDPDILRKAADYLERKRQRSLRRVTPQSRISPRR